MLFRVDGTFYDECEDTYEPHSYIVAGKNCADVLQQITDRWGDENVMTITIDFLNDDTLFEIDPVTGKSMAEADWRKN